MLSKKVLFYYWGVSAFVLAMVFSAGCTKNETQQAEEVEEKGRIEQMTDQAADEAVQKIRTPINKARTTRDYGDDRLESMDKAIQQQ